MPTAPLGSFTYTIKSGDTLLGIARKYDTTISNILAFNSITEPKNIKEGQKITIPKSPTDSLIYTAQPGDTIYSLAMSYGLQADTIVKFNYLSDLNGIKRGQKLVIPGSLL